MIFRNLTAQKLFPTDESVRRIWHTPFYRRQSHWSTGDKDWYNYRIYNPSDSQTIGLEHKWNNKNTGDFDFFIHIAEAQQGEILWLTKGEKFSVEVGFEEIFSSHHSVATDEWGWSDYDFDLDFEAIVDVGSQRERTTIWGTGFSVSGKKVHPKILATGLRKEFGPVPSTGYYIVWAGLRDSFWARMNDFSLESDTVNWWKLKWIKILQTPDQAAG